MRSTTQRHAGGGAPRPWLATLIVVAACQAPEPGDRARDGQLVASGPQGLVAETLVAADAEWRYWDAGGTPPAGWSAAGFDDAGWKLGKAPLGYGDPVATTIACCAAGSTSKNIAAYFRRRFPVGDTGAYLGLRIRLRRDDGAVVYVNGREAWRDNMPSGTIGGSTPASGAVGGSDETRFFGKTVDARTFLEANATNVVAVEVHQQSASSSDLSFALELEAADAPLLTRGPYLQKGTPTSALVRFRTDLPVLGRVRYGPSPTALGSVADGAAATTEHAIPIAGLQPETTYYYSVGSTTQTLAGGDASHFFRTPPPAGAARPIRVWAIGDAGTADSHVAAVRDAYLNLADTKPADVWLMLGDNAYPSGTDAQYQRAVFETFPTFLRQSFLWPTIGNHDVDNNAAATSPAYLEIFSLPTAGEAGGVRSGTERYYAFDVGNVHFVCLDSMTSSRAAGGAMLAWLENDLYRNFTQDRRTWLVAYWHHPPYSKGNHDSDKAIELVEMRKNALPILEKYGVDLVLSGHSHSYERSFLIDGHYGLSTEFGANHLEQGGSGSGSAPYAKGTVGPAAHEGAVYVVAGSGGELSTGYPLNHPAMYLSLAQRGSVVIDVDGATLTARFLRDTGAVGDGFTIEKGAAGGGAAEATEVTLVPRGASWRYFDKGQLPASTWTAAGYDDAAWAQGAAQLGYGDGDEKTVVGYGPSATSRYITTYFRTSVEIADPAALSELSVAYLRDDGIVVYLNGQEVSRSNMPTGGVSYATLASSALGGTAENAWSAPVAIPTTKLVAGRNVIAVELHQASASSSDLGFDLELKAKRAATTAAPPPPPPAAATFVARGATWRYFDKGQLPAAGWTATGYDDAAWAQGAAQLGYGDGDEKTVVGYGPSATSKYVTTYFRAAFTVSDPALYPRLAVELLRDDGIVVYLNGKEIARDNMPAGAVSYATLATGAAGADENSWKGPITIDAPPLVAGKNVIAVEVHQASASSSDLGFDLALRTP